MSVSLCENNNLEKKIQEFLMTNGYDGIVTLCAQDMSSRVYYRLQTHINTYIIMYAPPPENPERFIALSEHLIANGIAAPKIICFDNDRSLLLIEDFGHHTFTKILNVDMSSELSLYKAAVAVLKHLHKCPKPFFIESYTNQHLLREVEVFIDWYWLYTKDQKVPEVLKKEYMALWEELFNIMPSTPQSLVLRDYHCDNLMAIDETLPEHLTLSTCGVLDFQDALWGSVAYDFVSLVEDARRFVSERVVMECSRQFFEGYSPEEIQNIQEAGKILSAGRHVKILGVFARYALRQNNHSKCVHNVRVWRYLELLLEDPLLKDLAKWFAIHFPTAKIRR